MGDHPNYSCPECKKPAPRLIAGQPLSHSFAASPGTAKANSGVSQHDYPTGDNIVGRSAEMRWEEQHRKNAAKAEVRKTGVALSRREIASDSGRVTEYTALNQTQFDARKKLEGVFKSEGSKRGVRPALSKS